MTICNSQTEYVTVKLPYEEAKQIPNLKDLLSQAPPEEEPVATFREMAAIG